MHCHPLREKSIGCFREARYLLHHRDDNAELEWVILDGAIRIEVLAEELVVAPPRFSRQSHAVEYASSTPAAGGSVAASDSR